MCCIRPGGLNQRIPRIERSKFAPRVISAQDALHRNSFHAILTGRLIPGGRTPVIAALGLSHFPFRRFLPASVVACGIWAVGRGEHRIGWGAVLAGIAGIALAGAAIQSSSEHLNAVFRADLVASMSEEPQGLELGEITDAGSSSPDLDLPIEDLDLSERPSNCLKRAQVNTIGELLQKTEDDLLNITNFGQKSLDEVKQKLDERGLSLRG